MTEKILNRYIELINEATDLSNKAKKLAKERGDLRIYLYVNEPLFTKWIASSLNLLEKTFGNKSNLTMFFKDVINSDKNWYNILIDSRAILVSAKTEIEKGFLYNIKFLVAEEFYDSMIVYGKELLKNNLLIPSAVIGRIVIEDTLKKLCEKNEVPFDPTWKNSRINGELRKSGVYTLPMERRVQAFLDIGNSAAHGKTDDFSKNDIEDMFKFIEKNLLVL